MLGYTIVNDVTSQDPWLDGDQWLLGKSLPGFCPVGPWIVPADELDPADLRLASCVNGVEVQDGRTVADALLDRRRSSTTWAGTSRCGRAT